MIANLHPGPDRRLALHFNNPSVALRPIGRQMGGHAGEVLQYDAHLSFGPHADAEVHRAHSPFRNDAPCNVQVTISHYHVAEIFNPVDGTNGSASCRERWCQYV